MPAKKTTNKTAAKKTAPAKKATAKKVPAEKVAKTPAGEETKSNPTIVSAAPAKPVKKTAFAKKQEKKLLDLRDDLMEALHGVQSEAIKAASEGGDAGNGQHQGDAGSDSYDRDLALSMLEKEKDALHEVEAALERIENGTYGLDEIDGAKIPQERLEVLPFARLTIGNQERWEAEKRTRGVHPGEYGFGAFTESTKSVSLDASDD